MTNLTLKVMVKVTSFNLAQNLEMINERKNYQMVNLKFIFCKFKGQFDLEGQGQGQKFFK